MIVLQMLFHLLDCSSQAFQLLERPGQPSREKHQPGDVASSHGVEPGVEAISDDMICQPLQQIRKDRVGWLPMFLKDTDSPWVISPVGEVRLAKCGPVR